MSSAYRGELIALIWITMGLATIGVAVGSPTPSLMVIPIAVAVSMTMIMAVIPDFLVSLAAAREKSKRQPEDGVKLLLELLDDERAAFKETLTQRMLDRIGRTEDGELPADDQTLAVMLNLERTQQESRR